MGSLRSRRWWLLLLLLLPPPLLLLRVRPTGVEVEVDGAEGEAEEVAACCGANRAGAGAGEEDAAPLAGL